MRHLASRLSQCAACAEAITLLLLVTLPVPSVAQIHEWSKNFGSVNPCLTYASGVAIDSNGRVIVTGFFTGTASFDAVSLVSAGSNDIFVAAFDRDGNILWARRFGGIASDIGMDVAVDQNDNVVVVGEFNKTLPSESDVIVFKLDTNGVPVWSYTYGGPGTVAFPSSIAAGVSGAVCVTGQFNNSFSLGGPPLTSQGNYDIFIARFDSNGQHVWSKCFGGTASDLGQAVAFDSAGNIVLTGSFQKTADFGGGPLTSAGSDDICMVKLDAGGAHTWSHAYGLHSFDAGKAVAIDAADQIYMCGWVTNSVDLGGGAPPPAGDNFADVFVAKYGSDGAHVWSRRFPSNGTQFGQDVACMPAGGVVITGTMDFPLMIDNIVLSDGDVFTARFTTNGQTSWAHAYAQQFQLPQYSDAAYGIAAGTGGDFAFCGYFQGTANFGGPWLTSPCGLNMYVAKFSDTVPVPTLVQSFDAIAKGRDVLLQWQIYDGENAAAGYYVDRWSREELHIRITPTPLTGSSRSYVDANVVPGTEYSYQLHVMLRDGTELLSPVAQIAVPGAIFGDARSFPNPFNPNTTIAYDLDQRSHIVIAVFGSDGKHIRTLYDSIASAGNNEAEWDGRDDAGNVVASGLYMYRIQSGKRVITGKMMLVK